MKTNEETSELALPLMKRQQTMQPTEEQEEDIIVESFLERRL